MTGKRFSPGEASGSSRNRRRGANTTAILSLLAGAFLFSDASCHRSAKDMLAPLLNSPATVRPRILVSNPEPANGSYNDTADIFVQFDRPMDHTATEGAFSLTGSASPDGKKRWNGNFLFFDLTAPLTPGLPYVLRVAGSAKSEDGNTMETEYIVHFIAGSRIDAPTVLSSTPLSNAQGVDPTTQIVLVFSRGMNRESVEKSLQISPATYGSYTWSGGDTILTFTPYEGLTVPASYSVSLSTSATDAEGIALASPFAFSFQTGTDLTRPTVIDFREEGAIQPMTENPALGYYDGAYKDATFVITFSEPMAPPETAGAVSLVRSDNASPVGFQTTWQPVFARLEIRPVDPLEPETTFKLTVSTGAKDPSGNTLLSTFERRFRVSNAAGAVNSAYLKMQSATLTLPLHGGAVQPLDLSPYYTTTLKIAGSETATTGAQATFELKYSLPLDLNSLPEKISITKLLGPHTAQGRLIGIHPGPGVSQITLLVSELGEGNEYRLQINGDRSGLRSVTAPGETFTWQKEDAILNFRVQSEVVP